MGHAVVHFEIGGADRAALEKFYASVFGWKTQLFEPADYTMVQKMDDGIGGGIMKTPDGSSMVTVYVTCGDDVTGMLDKAKGLGATPIMEPTQVEGGPFIAMFADPQGHVIGLVDGDPDQAPPPEMQGEGAPVAWFELGCADASAAQDFYRKLFDWEINADNAMNYGEVKSVGGGIGGGIAPSMGGDPYTTVYVAADDLSATLEQIKGAGGSTQMEPMQVPGGPEIAQFTDPAGNKVGLLKVGSRA